MNRTRTGKIARLPKPVRDELALRLENGQPGQDLVQWLNDLPEVREILGVQFHGRRITEQNLSEWRQGAYFDWLQLQESRAFTAALAERHEELEDTAAGPSLSDRYAGLAAMELARLTATLVGRETDPQKRWQRLCEVLRELSRLRRDDHSATRTLIARKQWDREAERQAAADLEAGEPEEWDDRCAPSCGSREPGPISKLFAGRPTAREMIATILKMAKVPDAEDLLPAQPAPTPEPPLRGDPAPRKSEPNRPDPT